MVMWLSNQKGLKLSIARLLKSISVIRLLSILTTFLTAVFILKDQDYRLARRE